MARPGGRGGLQHAASAAEREAQVTNYVQHTLWVERQFGLPGEAFKKHLENASSIARTLRGFSDIPQCLHMKNATVREHALLLCRVDGLRKAAAAISNAVVSDKPGSDDADSDASNKDMQELSRLECLSAARIKDELRCVPTAWRKELGLVGVIWRGGGWIPGLYEMSRNGRMGSVRVLIRDTLVAIRAARGSLAVASAASSSSDDITFLKIARSPPS